MFIQMSEQCFGDGLPSPREMSQYYLPGGSVPEFGYRDPFEVPAAYRANGLMLEAVALPSATIAELLEELVSLKAADGLRRYLGPVIDEAGILQSGIGRWRAKTFEECIGTPVSERLRAAAQRANKE